MALEQPSSADKQAVISNRTMEIIVAVLLLAFGAVIAWNSYSLGAKWAEDGPQAGYFPFYIGLIIAISSLITLVQALRGAIPHPRDGFVERAQLKQVLAVLIPAVIYVLAIQWFGIYLASAVYMAVFMVWLGKYAWWKGVLLGLSISVCVYLMFEVWFKVILHKGTLYNPLTLIGL